MWLVLDNQALNFGISEIGMLAQINFGVFMSLDYGYIYVNISKTNISTFFFVHLILRYCFSCVAVAICAGVNLKQFSDLVLTVTINKQVRQHNLLNSLSIFVFGDLL